MAQTPPTSIRITDEVKKKIKILAVTHDIKVGDIYTIIGNYIASLPEKDIVAILKK